MISKASDLDALAHEAMDVHVDSDLARKVLLKPCINKQGFNLFLIGTLLW